MLRRIAAIAALLLAPAALAAEQGVPVMQVLQERGYFVAEASAAPAPKGETNPDEAANAPIALTVRGEELGKLLESAGWVHNGKGRVPLYTVGFRSCPDCVAQHEGAYAKLEEAGADIRKILYARADSADGKPRSKPGERAMIAELWKTRDYALYERWYETDPATFYETEPLPPDADSDPARAAYVQKSRDFIKTLSELLAANGVETFVPAIFWQENGIWQVYIGYDPNTFDGLILPRIAGA